MDSDSRKFLVRNSTAGSLIEKEMVANLGNSIIWSSSTNDPSRGLPSASTMYYIERDV